MNNYRRLVSAGMVSLLVMVIILVGGRPLTAAFAQDALKFTGCVNRKGKIKFLAEGETPLKSCKGKQIQIMFPSTLKTLQLQQEQESLQSEVDDLVTSNFFWFGGSTGNDSFCCNDDQNTVRYMGPFVSRLAKEPTQVQQPVISFAGRITTMQISVDSPVTNPVIYTLFPGGKNTCVLDPGDTSCSVSACEPLLPNDQIYVEVEASSVDCHGQPNCAAIPPSRWIAVFEPLGTC